MKGERKKKRGKTTLVHVPPHPNKQIWGGKPQKETLKTHPEKDGPKRPSFGKFRHLG
jgi:hypothetical protein